MLKCTTTGPYPSFLGGELDDIRILVEDVKDFPGLANVPKDIRISSNIYLHGRIEERAGFDIPIWLDGDYEVDMVDGIHDCEVHLREEVVLCKLYCWHVEPYGTLIGSGGATKNYISIKGFIIEEGDESKKFVEEKYHAKEEWI